MTQGDLPAPLSLAWESVLPEATHHGWCAQSMSPDMGAINGTCDTGRPVA